MNTTHRSASSVTGISLPINCSAEPKSGKYFKTTEINLKYASF